MSSKKRKVPLDIIQAGLKDPDCDVRACIHCIWYDQHYRKNHGNIAGFVPLSFGTCLKHDVRRGALRQPCKDYETDKGSQAPKPV